MNKQLINTLVTIGTTLVDKDKPLGKTNASTVSGGTLLTVGIGLATTSVEPITIAAGVALCLAGLGLMAYRDKKAEKAEEKEEKSE